MIERADQLVLNYVSKAADAAHGVLRSDQRLDFVKRLRARIEEERRGSQDAREVARVLARFGDPKALVAREVNRLAQNTSAPADSGAGGLPGYPAAADGATAVFPSIVDDAEPVPSPPGVEQGRRPAQQRLARRGLSFAGLRRAAMSSANPMATEGRDAVSILREHRREVLAMAILVLAALLIPFNLPAVAIFRVPVLVWALGAVLVLSSDSWALRDRLLGIGAPILGYTVGGVLVGGLRSGGQQGLQAFFVQFYDVSGVMFMIGAGLGVVWLAYRLFDVN
ncbi:hypothetical protein [Nonomuraea sediminis]|uniref:hypothetical protein n=1 Tax=Nonomuraea sediminis TaxID=2835864 RepID=UPI001BDBE6F6|nr:hypothetical protein [Nonomuraea sediminis]